jgi:hypothetical protein
MGPCDTGGNESRRSVEAGSLMVLDLGPLESKARDVFLGEVDTVHPPDRLLAPSL